MDPVSREKLNQVFSNLRAGSGAAAEPQTKTRFNSQLDRWGHNLETRLASSSAFGKVLGYTGVVLGFVTLTLPLYLAVKGKFTSYVKPVSGGFQDSFWSQVSKSQWKSLSRFGKGENETHANTTKDRILRSNAMKLISIRPEAQELQALLKQCTTRQLCQLARGIGKEDLEKVESAGTAASEASQAAEPGGASVPNKLTTYQLSWSPTVFEQLREVQRGIKSSLLDEPILRTFEDYDKHRDRAQELVKFQNQMGADSVAILPPQQVPESAAAVAPDLTAPMRAQDLKGVRALVADLLLPANLARAAALLQGGDKALAATRDVLREHQDALALLCARPDDAADAQLPAGLGPALRQALALPGPLAVETPPTPAQWQAHEQQVRAAIDGLAASQAQVLGQTVNQVADQFNFAPYSGQLQAIDTGLRGPMANFFKDVFKNYFSQQPQEDRRSMVASLLRQSMPADSQDDQLAALLKGAGPFMHKTLQLFCDKVQVQSTKTALSSVKTGLTPIERDLKTAMLERIVLDSNGNIEALRDVRSLGAASVGEALLADVQERPGADGKAVTRRVVIKLLRPGIVERAQRERAFFAETASRHKGVGSTFAGIAEQIEAEMDLKSEAKNVQAGQVYNGQATQLQAMKLSNLVPAQPNYMVVEQAPGSALQHYIDLSEKVARDDEVRGAEAELVGRKAAAQVAQLGRVWMAQALAGDGFFHGDLHAGNLMFNGDTGQLTVIDFGNAAVIDPKQRETLIRLAMTLQRGHPRLFEKEFRHLLGPSSESLAWAFKNSAIAQIKYIMRDGALDLADKLARILDEYTSAGLEVPAVITNFSRSMLMLQETLGRLNEVNRENFLRQHELGSELLKDRDECVARSRAPLDQDERELLQTQVNSINARLKIIKSPKPESMSDAFTQAVRPHAVKLVWRAGLGFAARVLKTSIEASTGFELEIARAKDKIVEMDDRIKQADVDEKVALKAKRQLLQKELDALLGLATPEVPAVPAASEAAA